MGADDRKTSRALNADRLDRSRALVRALVGVSALGLAVLLIHPWTISRHSTLAACQEVVRALSLSAPAWSPSGRASRQPEALHPAVDLRPSPALPLFDTSPEGLLISVPGPARRRGEAE